MYACKYCPRTFVSMEALHQHHKDKHVDIQPYPLKHDVLRRYSDDDDSEAWHDISRRYGI